jgi:hypothetical protein
MLAVVRPDSWNFPLLLHVLGAMLLVGSLLFVTITLVGAWRGGSAALVRSGANVLLVAVIPSYLLMRLAAEWIVSKEHLKDAHLSWLDIGFTTADLGALLIIVATAITGFGVRRINRGAADAGLGVRIATVLVAVLVVAYLVAIWAMTTKPT